MCVIKFHWISLLLSLLHLHFTIDRRHYHIQFFRVFFRVRRILPCLVSSSQRRKKITPRPREEWKTYEWIIIGKHGRSVFPTFSDEFVLSNFFQPCVHPVIRSSSDLFNSQLNIFFISRVSRRGSLREPAVFPFSMRNRRTQLFPSRHIKTNARKLSKIKNQTKSFNLKERAEGKVCTLTVTLKSIRR